MLIYSQILQQPSNQQLQALVCLTNGWPGPSTGSVPLLSWASVGCETAAAATFAMVDEWRRTDRSADTTALLPSSPICIYNDGEIVRAFWQYQLHQMINSVSTPRPCYKPDCKSQVLMHESTRAWLYPITLSPLHLPDVQQGVLSLHSGTGRNLSYLGRFLTSIWTYTMLLSLPFKIL